MDHIETLLKQDAGRYETPKKLNRSAHVIPERIVEEVEAGSVSFEQLLDLGSTFPILKYRTCLTIHGTWPDLKRHTIGGYRNIHRNANGSLEVKWNAIDLHKKHAIAGHLKRAGSPMQFELNSSRAYFEESAVLTADNFEEIVARYKAKAEAVNKINAYTRAHVWKGSVWGRHFLVLSVDVLAVPSESQTPLMFALAGVTNWEQFDQLAAAETERREAERVKREQDEAIREAEYQRKREVNDALRAQVMPQLEAGMATLKPGTNAPGSTLVLLYWGRRPGSYSMGEKEPVYLWVRNDGKGPFGTTKYVSACTSTLDEAPRFDKLKQKVAEKWLSQYNGWKQAAA